MQLLGGGSNAAPAQTPSAQAPALDSAINAGMAASGYAPAGYGAAPYPTSDGSLPPIQDFGDYRDKAGSSGFWNGVASHASPGSILGVWGGGIAGRDAAQLNSANTYLKMLQDRAATQGQQLDTGQTVALLRNLGYPINPNNIPAAFAGPSQAAAQASPSPEAAPSAPPAPVNAPQGAGAAPSMPQTSVVPGASPADALRARLTAMAATLPTTAGMSISAASQPTANGGGNPVATAAANYARMAQAMMLPKYAAQALDFNKLAQTNIPQGAVRTPDGVVRDVATGAPIMGSIGEWQAHNAGLTAREDANARVPAAEAIAGNQAALDRATALYKSGLDFSHTVVGKNGEAIPVSNAQLATGTGPAASSTGNSFPMADNPMRAPQIKEQEEANTQADDAAKSQAQVQQLGAAIKQFGTTGPWAQKYLDVLRGLKQGGFLDDATVAKLGAGELANMDSNSIVAAMAKAAAAGRVPLGIYNQINKMKPSILSGNPGLAIEALNQDFQRAQDLAAFKAEYYADPANRSKLDATTAFNKVSPPEKYQSAVLPLPLPKSKADAKIGFTYNIGGHKMTWDGAQFQPFKGAW
jgi:hypothetical protein